MDQTTPGLVVVGSIRKLVEEASNRGLYISSCLPVSALFEFLPSLLLTMTVVYTCKPNKPFPPQLALGLGVPL